MKNRLLSLLEANKNRGKGLRAEVKDDEASIYVYDALGGYFGIDPSDFARTLDGIDASTIHLRINSPGGDIFDARSMQTLLAQHPANVIGHVDGLSASAATFLMSASNEIRMSEGAFLMIHKGWTLMVGNSDDFTDMASMLNKVDDSIAKTYAKRTGQDHGEMMQMMAAETWFNADEALEIGFVDVVDDIAPEPANAYNLGAYSNTPAALLEPTGDESWLGFRAKLDRQIQLIEVRA